MRALCFGLFVTLLVACREPASVRVSPLDSRIQRMGRFDTRDHATLRFAWPATEVALAFTGSSLHATLTDTPRPDDTPATDWLAIEVDEGPAVALALKQGKQRYTLASGLGDGNHRIRIVKRTEPEVGTVTLHELELAPGASLAALPPRPARMLEFIGDSISAGYGNLGPDGTCHFNARDEDATRTYAALSARELEADFSVSAWSGKGVLRNYEARDRETLPQIFERILPDEPGSPSAPVTPEPAAVIIHVGTNDFFPGIPDEEPFVTAYLSLLSHVRARAPHAKLVSIVTPMLADDYPHPNARSTLRRYLERIVAHERAQGRQLDLLDQWIDPAEGVGCDFHPNLRGHARMARELAEVLRALRGW